jgi:hypothetical protein
MQSFNYQEPDRIPIKAPSLSALDSYRWPRPDPAEFNAQLGRQSEALYETTDYVLVGSAVIWRRHLLTTGRVVGLQNFLMALITGVSEAVTVAIGLRGSWTQLI